MWAEFGAEYCSPTIASTLMWACYLRSFFINIIAMIGTFLWLSAIWNRLFLNLFDLMVDMPEGKPRVRVRYQGNDLFLHILDMLQYVLVYTVLNGWYGPVIADKMCDLPIHQLLLFGFLGEEPPKVNDVGIVKAGIKGEPTVLDAQLICG